MKNILYLITVEVPAMGPMSDLKAALDLAYRDYAAGRFKIIATHEPGYMVVFERNLGNGAMQQLQSMVASGCSDLQRAAMQQLADELQQGAGQIADPVIEVLRSGDAQVVDFNNHFPEEPEQAAKPAEQTEEVVMCPNCGQHPVKNHPQTGCVLAALVQVLRDRGEYTEQQLHAIHANCNEDLLWDDIGDIANRLGNGEFGTQDEAPPEEQTVITMACADEDFAMREFALIGHDAQGKPDYACKHCGWMQSSAAAGAAELLANASWESDEAREEFLAKVATIINEDKATSGLKVFEVTAAGFDGSTDETDDDVIWVAALSQADVEKAIADTGAKLWGEVTHWTPYVFDFTVPGQAAQLATALLEAASEARNKNRPV